MKVPIAMASFFERAGSHRRSPRQPSVVRVIAYLFAGMVFFMLAHAAHAQPRNNDYYASRGTSLLYNVEKFHLGLAEEEIGQKRYLAAFGDLRFILNYFPNHPKALALMAQTCTRWKDARCDADEFFARGIARNPNIAATHIVYGIHLLRIHRNEGGIKALGRALEIQPNSLNAHYNIALGYLETKQYDLANEHAQKAYALGPAPDGLRERLQRAGHWKPAVTEPPTTAPPAPAASNAAEQRPRVESSTPSQ